MDLQGDRVFTPTSEPPTRMFAESELKQSDQRQDGVEGSTENIYAGRKREPALTRTLTRRPNAGLHKSFFYSLSLFFNVYIIYCRLFKLNQWQVAQLMNCKLYLTVSKIVNDQAIISCLQLIIRTYICIYSCLL